MPKWDVRFDLNIELGDHALVRRIEKASALAGVINGVPIPPHVRMRLDQLNIHRAVRGTTGIEGSDLSEEEVAKVLRSPADEQALPDSRKREEQEVRNALNVLIFVADTLDSEPDRPLTEALVCEIHKLTTLDIAYKDNVPGAYRNHGVSAGSYSAPSPELVRGLMGAFIDWLNDGGTSNWSPIIRAIAAHFYLISIHPFGDGNGRTARAVESYLLYQAGINACGFYSLSNFYYKSRADYEGMLDYVRFESGGDLTAFIRFAADGLVGELELVHSEVLEQITTIAYRDYARERLTETGKIGTKAGERMLAIVQALAGLGTVTLEDPHIRLAYANVSAKTLKRDLDFLAIQELLVRDKNEIRPNLAIMEPYKIRGPARSGNSAG